MLTLYRRHVSKCDHAKTEDKRAKERQTAAKEEDSCKCPIWIQGTWDGKTIRKSLDVTRWSKAVKLQREIEDGTRPQEPKEEAITVEHALNAFISECESRNLNVSTLRKYRLLSKSLIRSIGGERDLRTCDAEAIRRFRSSRTLAARTSSKELERIRAFFNFCVENDWLQKNPAKKIKAPEVKPNPTLPFTDQEVAKILAESDSRSRIFFLVLLNTGLRIIDAAQLRPEKIIDGRLFLHTEKTGVPVFLPLPPHLLAELQSLPLVGGFYFATESSNPISIAEYYRQKLLKAALKAGLMTKRKKGDPRRKNEIHPHRFRDTFATRLLMNGVPIEMVQKLLGHSSIKITEESYAPWIKGRQEQMEEALKGLWNLKPKLVKTGAR